MTCAQTQSRSGRRPQTLGIMSPCPWAGATRMSARLLRAMRLPRSHDLQRRCTIPAQAAKTSNWLCDLRCTLSATSISHCTSVTAMTAADGTYCISYGQEVDTLEIRANGTYRHVYASANDPFEQEGQWRSNGPFGSCHMVRLEDYRRWGQEFERAPDGCRRLGRLCRQVGYRFSSYRFGP